MKLKELLNSFAMSKEISFLTLLPYHKLKLKELHRDLDALYHREFINEIAQWSKEEN